MENRIYNYKQFEEILAKSNYIGIFGAGYNGKTWGYDVIKAAGYEVNAYFDNKVKVGTIIHENIKVESLELLQKMHETITLFIASGFKFQEEIVKSIEPYNIKNYFFMDDLFMQDMIESIHGTLDEKINEKYAVISKDDEFLKRQYEYHLKNKLDLINPKTFSEKLQWLKLYNKKPEYTAMVDKIKLKDYVVKKVGEGYTFPTIGSWDNVDEIKLDELPDKFVLKCNHDCGSIQICNNRDKFDFEKAKKYLSKKFEFNYFWAGREWPYKNVERKIFAEPYMGENIIDYKFMCFNGKVRSIFTCTDRFSFTGLKVTFFDKKWEKMPFERKYPSSKEKIEVPQNLELMIEIAERLSENIEFVRVDFYEIEGAIYVGEMTFFPGGGLEDFRPIEWDLKFGNWLNLPDKN